MVSTSVGAAVLPVCGYAEDLSGKAMAQFLSTGAISQIAANTDQNVEDWQEPYPDFEKYAEDSLGHWYLPRCWRERAGDMTPAEFQVMETEFEAVSSPVYAPAGSAPPAPMIDGRTLARAAWDAVTIPDPQIGYNPTLGDSGATLVGWYTWVWATGDTPAQVTATATAGPVSATVTAVAEVQTLNTTED
ncbi:Uncharacterised protein [Actinomyces howellii]|uniref:Uncharacterized protein n=1 Tax=Actinomyces howellii TaxID=52771 RepID=A0A448HHZ5_9ACTO|nr:Uncharacterised protein [Actinomyces howellii]